MYEEDFPPRLMLVPSEKFEPHIKRGGYNTGAYFVNVSAFKELRPSLLDFAALRDWKFSHGLRDQGLMNDYFKMLTPGRARSRPKEERGHRIIEGLRVPNDYDTDFRGGPR